MAEKKRKDRHENGEGRKKRKHPFPGALKKLKKNKDVDRRKRKGPRLPNALRRELDAMNHANAPKSDGEEMESDGFDVAGDVYEYEEGVPQEESMKNRRFDHVDNFEYELPEQFEDENVGSDEDENNDEDDSDDNNDRQDHEEDEVEEEDGGRHARMLQGITGLPVEAFERKKRKNDLVVSEAYPESEYNPSRDVLDGDGRISIHDLLDPLHGKSGFSKLRKSMQRMEKKSQPLHAPLPKADREKLERKVAYEQSKKIITKWEPLVKRNREAPTLYFDEDTNLGFSTVGAIASEFEPRSEFEKKIASLVDDNEVVEAHKKDGARLLELNKVSIEDVEERQNRLAKMRTLLFRHELKAKRIKKIKSKAYHRLLKRDRLKAVTAEIEMDPEAAKDLAMKQEFKRAEERLTLKHKNSSKWAKRILKRGLNVQDEGTRAAITEQLHQHALLTRKMNSMKDGSSCDDSSDEDEDDADDISDISDKDRALKLLEKAKEKTLGVLEEEDEVAKSGVLSLPFMVRGLQRRKEAADEEAKLALEEYESSLQQLDDNSIGKKIKTEGTGGGRRVFGASRKHVEEIGNKAKVDNYYGNSDSEDNLEAKEDADIAIGQDRRNNFQRDVNIDPDFLREESQIDHDHLFKSFNDVVKDPGPQTTYEVAIFASDSWKKMPKKDNEQIKSEKKLDANMNSSEVEKPALHDQDVEEEENDSDSGSDMMVDGVLSSGTKSTYELPSQTDLIRRAFAGDDVEDDFEKDKQEVLNEENPEPEKPVLLPGWGQWTHIQKKKGLPSWMLEEHENAKKKRDEALKKRKDGRLKHVIISEKLDKKAEKLHTKTLPYPYTSQDVFEQSIRMPIGPEFNPVTAVGALNRPEVVKKTGVIIKPIKFEDLNPHEREERSKRSGHKQKKGSGRSVRSANADGVKVK